MRDDSARRTRWYPAGVIAVVLAVLAGGAWWNVDQHPHPVLLVDAAPERPLPAAGPGAGTPYADLVRHALADLDALSGPDGITLAGSYGVWRYVWPRDASFVAAARCAVGQQAAGARVLDYLDQVRPAEGRWQARYLPASDGVPDDRKPQLDGSGWVLWATWFCDRDLDRRWPMVLQSADHIAAELGDDGLPKPSPDYWERPESEVTLGTVAPLLTGLRGAIAIAGKLGRSIEADRWQQALDRLDAATRDHFGPDYPRTRPTAVGHLEPGLGPLGVGGGADAAVTVLGPPFAPADPVVSAAITEARTVLTQPNGGVTPGEQWRPDGVAWTPQTALFALSAAARGDRATADDLLHWLDTHRTATGALPEKVNRAAEPAGPAPLGWTSSIVVLAVTALDRPLPVP